MFTLGIHGGVNTAEQFLASTPRGWLHDAAAVLCQDGQVIAAAEEERFLRIKHVNFFPLSAIRHCLNVAEIELPDIHRLVLSSLHMNELLEEVNRWRYGLKSWTVNSSYLDFAATRLNAEFHDDTRSRLSFAGHHNSHAVSTVWLSGFPEALCVVLDGFGDGYTGMIASFHNGKLDVLRKISTRGPAWLYLAGTHILGYDVFDEYKVMGLAPYGTAERFRKEFSACVDLKNEGEFEIISAGLSELRKSLDGRSSKDGVFNKEQCDFAAGLQCIADRVLFHVLNHFKDVTGHENLCLAGGFAQNCTSNGRVLSSNLFKRVFVQPVAYDAGCAIGAALHGYLEEGGKLQSTRMSHLFWGTGTPGREQLLQFLDRWSPFIEVSEPSNLAGSVASLLTEGKVVAWVQGRAEFGARALGNRSIIADPRPAENRQRINDMIKKREAFRPFAPSVLEEYLHEYFEVSTEVDALPFMVFVVQVREQYRSLLGAITHVDGSARVQSVSRVQNEKYWNLINAFRAQTGVPIVLNTSFNNAHEPIVDTDRDAMNCFLSTSLDYLVIGDYLIAKKSEQWGPSILCRLSPRFAARYYLARKPMGSGRPEYCIHDRYRDEYRAISAEAYCTLLLAADEHLSLENAMQRLAVSSAGMLTDELFQLWCQRVFTCDPKV